jgi:hypothetical protein
MSRNFDTAKPPTRANSTSNRTISQIISRSPFSVRSVFHVRRARKRRLRRSPPGYADEVARLDEQRRDDRRLLALVLGEHAHSAALSRYVDQGNVTEIRVVAPAQVDALHWYATDEDEATADAARRADSIRSDVAPLSSDAAAADAGDADPVQAVQDALASFPADEIVVVGERADEALESSLGRFGLPVRRLGIAREDRPHGRARELGRGIMSGRSAATPYAVFVGVMLFLGAVVLIGGLIWLLVMWIL